MHERLKSYKIHVSVLVSAIAIVAIARIHLYMMRTRPAYVTEHGLLFAAFLAISTLGIVAVFHLVWYRLVERKE